MTDLIVAQASFGTVGPRDTQAPLDFPNLCNEKQVPQYAAAQAKPLKVYFSWVQQLSFVF